MRLWRGRLGGCVVAHCSADLLQKEVFTLKQLEKQAPKKKGIVSQSVKEVLQSLVDDSMVDQDKIGTSNFFWSFPSQSLIRRRNKLEALDAELAQKNEAFEALQERRAAITGKDDSVRATPSLFSRSRTEHVPRVLQPLPLQ